MSDGDAPLAPKATEALRLCVTSLVEDPDAVRITASERNDGVKLSTTVAEGDMGRVIGRRGRVANAIRTIVAAAATMDGVEVEVDFDD